MSEAGGPHTAGQTPAPRGAGDGGGPVTAIVHAGGPHVLPLLERVEQQLRDVAGGHGPVLAGHAGSTIAAGGKRLRPLLVILAAGGPVEPADGLVRAAVAVELVHSATLVHDDVLDLAPLRRGIPTVFATAGRQAATQTGDLLFARAFALLAANGDAEQVRALSYAGSALARGELLQRADAFDATIALDRYLHRCELKTARLFEAACTLGALEAGRRGGADHPAEALREFGRSIGLAFQILDDVLDVEGPAERTGKHRGTDLLDGTVTLPFILARERDPGLAALDPREIRDPEQAAEVCDRIAATGALAAARETALEHVAAAKAVVPAGLPERERTALLLVADGVVARYS
jgi:geranylgeranyl pyrophosphate synthase